MSLCTFSDLEVSFKGESTGESYVSLAGRPHLSKLILHVPRPMGEIQSLAEHLASPFQIFFGPGMNDKAYGKKVLRSLSEINPFVPMEVIFIEPGMVPDTREMLGAMTIHRPHFLDHDLRYLYPEPGNRAVQFTVISRSAQLFFRGEMRRQVYLWDRDPLPGEKEFDTLSHLDGILIDSSLPLDILWEWQDRFSKHHGEFLAINFAPRDLQIRWMELTTPERYHMQVLKNRGSSS